MTSNAWHEDAKDNRRDQQTTSSRQTIHRQGGEPDFDSAWQALRNLTESSLARSIDHEFAEDFSLDKNPSSQKRFGSFATTFEHDHQDVKVNEQETIRRFLPTEMTDQKKPDSIPHTSPVQDTTIDKTQMSIKPPRKALELSSIVLCAIYLTVGYLGAGLVDKLRSQDLWAKASQSIKEKLLLALQDPEPPEPETLPAQMTSEPANSEVKHGPYKIAVKLAVVRNAPSLRAKVVGSLNRGTIFVGLPASMDEQWIKITEDQFVSRSLVEDMSNPSRKESDSPVLSEPISEPRRVASETFWAVDPTLSVYDKADLSSALLMQLPYATELKGQTVQGGKWFKLDSGGFVERETLGESKPFYTKPGRAVLAEIAVQRAPLMDAPRASASMTGIFFKSKQVTVHRIIDGWAEVSKGQYIKASQLVHIQPKQSFSKQDIKE